MSENAEKPEVSLKEKEEIRLKVSSASAPEISSELSSEHAVSSELAVSVPKTSDSESKGSQAIVSAGGAGGDNEQNAKTHGLTLDETSSSGLMRHKLIVAACLCVSLSLLFLNSLDLKHLIERDAIFEDNTKLTFVAPKAELPPDLSYSDFNEPLWRETDLQPVFKSSWKGKLFGFVDGSGKVVVQPQFAWVYDFSDGLAAARVGEGEKAKWGYIDKTGQFKIPPKFSNAFMFSHGMAIVNLDKRQIFIDKTGRQIVPEEFRGFNRISTGFIVHTNKKRSGILDFSGKWILPPIYTEIKEFHPAEITSPPSRVVPSTHQSEVDAKFLKIRRHDLYGVAKPSGEIVIEPKYEDVISYHNGIAAVSVNGKIGFIDDKTGKFLISPQFDYATPFDSIMAVKKSGEWSFINQRGEPIASSKFDKVITEPNGDWFANGLGPVVVNKKVGYVNEAGEFGIKPFFDMASTFKNEHALVYFGERYRIIDTAGKVIPGFVFGSLYGDYGKKVNVKIPGPLFPIVNRSEIRAIQRDINDWNEGRHSIFWNRRGPWEF